MIRVNVIVLAFYKSKVLFLFKVIVLLAYWSWDKPDPVVGGVGARHEDMVESGNVLLESQLESGGVDVVRGDLSQEYASVDMYIREATGGTTTTAAATFDKQSEADTVQALLDSLPSSLDQCATMAFDFIE